MKKRLAQGDWRFHSAIGGRMIVGGQRAKEARSGMCLMLASKVTLLQSSTLFFGSSPLGRRLMLLG